jgi:3-methyl-2-oxobutanoate hydroxymethyltransferase
LSQICLFGSYESSPEQALATATFDSLKKPGAMADEVRRCPHCNRWKNSPLLEFQSMGHLGLTPQSLHQLGGYRVQGRTDGDAILVAALALEKAGAFCDCA